MRFDFHNEAKLEFFEAIAYYDKQQAGLGRDFAEEVYGTIVRVCEMPEAFPRVFPKTRRGMVARFPFGVVYQVRGGTVWIIAVAHLHRMPNYWAKRR